jgi:hypothetical protein
MDTELCGGVVFCIRARLQPCRNLRVINEGFTPCMNLITRKGLFQQPL